jgi:hypothetical protein
MKLHFMNFYQRGSTSSRPLSISERRDDLARRGLHPPSTMLTPATHRRTCSWTAVLDAVRPGPTDDATAVTATQLRAVVDRLMVGGHWLVPRHAITDRGTADPHQLTLSGRLRAARHPHAQTVA